MSSIVEVKTKDKTYKIEVAPKETQTIAKWRGAINICHTLNINGHNDWILPLPEELMAISQDDSFRDARYWTADTYGTCIATYVVFENGKPVEKRYDSDREIYSVRAIRIIKDEQNSN